MDSRHVKPCQASLLSPNDRPSAMTHWGEMWALKKNLLFQRNS